jgi:GAF domain-containing protein
MLRSQGVTTEREALAEAERTIARRDEELERLRNELADQRFAADLRDALKIAATAGVLGSPATHDELLRLIVETAAHVIGARGGALLLVSEQDEELIFEVAVGTEADELEERRMPLGQGIAGLVATSGQPIALKDAGSDPRVSSDIVQAIGYVPESILCVPLLYADRVIGVLELVDKEGAASFSGRDIDSLSLFAGQAAVAIRQSRTHRNLAILIDEILDAADGSAEDSRELHARGRAFAGRVEEDEAYRRVVRLTELVHEIGRHGDDELDACYEILRTFTAYLRSRPRAADELP